jgi:16S rRNA (guanine(966)-N(2))-methyltransferase RsmD
MAQPRIIGGKARGIRIASVPGDTTRPITDRVKEALFNIIGPDIVDSNFLDLFGGTGSVGIEALSRGAKSCMFLDFSPQAVRVIKQNLSTTHLETNTTVRQGDAFQFLRSSTQIPFDYIFIAPPQYKNLWIDAITLLDKNISLLSEDGWVIVQIDPVEETEIKLVNLNEFDRRRYGTTLLLLYARAE